MKNISTLFLLILAFGLSGCFFQEEKPEEKEALRALISMYKARMHGVSIAFGESLNEKRPTEKEQEVIKSFEKELTFGLTEAETITDLRESILRYESSLEDFVRDSLQSKEYQYFRKQLFSLRISDKIRPRDKMLYVKLSSSLKEWVFCTLLLQKAGYHSFKIMGMTDTLALGEEYISHLAFPGGIFIGSNPKPKVLTTEVFFEGKQITDMLPQIESFYTDRYSEDRVKVFRYTPSESGNYMVVFNISIPNSEGRQLRRTITFNVTQK